MKGKRYSRRAWWLAFAVCYVSASCVMSPRHAKVAPHQWKESRGPVVPHDTFPRDCSLCHEGGGWQKIRSDFQFDHARDTGVPLAGAHQRAECLRCHNDRGPVAVFARRGCVGCHEDEHRGQLGSQCAQCHNESNWIPEGQIILHNRTRFPLVGSHTAVACFRCHPGAQVGNFVRAPVRCEACHQDDLARAKQPDHAAQGWTENCDRCHQPTTWSGAGFDHSRFPLTGAHLIVDCSACHNGGVFTGLSHGCVDCHLPDFQAATNPNHVSGNFSTDCQSCHNTVSWQGAAFQHAGVTSGCVQCHLPDYQGTSNPNHLATGIPQNCESCHNTNTWQGAVFNHAGITSGCTQCHLSDFQATTNPNHLAAGFPQNCELCHSTTMWQGAVFTHSFNIRSGPHRSFSCAECHQTPSSYQIVSCIHCHEHRQSVADDKHSGVSGYSWNSAACVSCHPNGN